VVDRVHTTSGSITWKIRSVTRDGCYKSLQWVMLEKWDCSLAIARVNVAFIKSDPIHVQDANEMQF